VAGRQRGAGWRWVGAARSKLSLVERAHAHVLEAGVDGKHDDDGVRREALCEAVCTDDLGFAKAAVARKILIAAWHMLLRNEPCKPAPPTTSVSASSRVALAA
jgi:hypothetical protein